jgi:hypothetical protein
MTEGLSEPGEDLDVPGAELDDGMRRLARRMRRIIITVSGVMIMMIWKRIGGIRKDQQVEVCQGGEEFFKVILHSYVFFQ